VFIFGEQRKIVNTRPGDPRFYRLLDEIANLHARKSQDYSPASDPLKNFRSAADFGVRPYAGVLTRLRQSAGQDVEGGCGQLRSRSVAARTMAMVPLASIVRAG
jgi:hypothetical protein